ncbi:MAG: hypothetical protein WDM96_18740 [Lacunisphaera sp.]
MIEAVHTAIATRHGIARAHPETRVREVATYAWGAALNFSAGGNAQPFLGPGWSEPEPTACWTSGTSAEVHLRVRPMEGTDLILTAQLSPLVSAQTPAQLVRISINGAPTGQWSVSSPGLQHTMIFARHLSGLDRLSLRFDLPRAFSPQAHGLSADPRLLAVSFQQLTLRPVNPSNLFAS